MGDEYDDFDFFIDGFGFEVRDKFVFVFFIFNYGKFYINLRIL